MKKRRILLVGLTTAFCLVLFARVSARGLWRPDAFDYAQIARELSEGRGFSSRQAIYVLHLRFLQANDLVGADWPNLHRFPLPSVAMAALFLVVGATDGAVIAYGIVFHSLTAMLLFHWGMRLSEWRCEGPPREVMSVWWGVAPVALLTLNGVLLETACSGLAEPPVVFFFTLALYLVWRIRDEPRQGHFLGLGVALGLAALGRTNIVLVVPLFALFTCLGGPRRIRWRGLLFLGGGFLLTLSPWLIRNQLVAGSPLFSLHTYFLLPAGNIVGGDKWDLAQPWVTDFVSPLEFARQNSAAVVTKWLHNFELLLRDFPRFGGTRYLPLVALLACGFRSSRGLRPIAWLAFLGFTVNAVAVSLSDTYFDKYHFHSLPAMMLLAAAVVWRAARRFRNGHARTVVLLLALAVMIDLPGILDARARVEWKSSRFPEANMAFIRENTREDAVISSDQSYAVAWYTGRRSVRSYLRQEENGEMGLAAPWFRDEFGLAVESVYLSRYKLHRKEWRDAVERSRRDPGFREVFPRDRRFADGSILFYR